MQLSFNSFQNAKKKKKKERSLSYSCKVCRNVCKGSAVQRKDITRSSLILNMSRKPGSDRCMVTERLFYIHLALQNNNVLEWVWMNSNENLCFDRLFSCRFWLNRNTQPDNGCKCLHFLLSAVVCSRVLSISNYIHNSVVKSEQLNLSTHLWFFWTLLEHISTCSSSFSWHMI